VLIEASNVYVGDTKVIVFYIALLQSLLYEKVLSKVAGTEVNAY